MKRREFIALVGGAVIASSSARAQQPAKTRRTGVLETVWPALNMPNLDALRRGLRDLGHIPNQNCRLEYRSADAAAARLPALLAELARLGVDLRETPGTAAVRPPKEATEH